MLTNALTVIGAILLVHAGYSYRHYNQLVSVLDIVESKYPPFDVIVELVVGFLLVVIAQTISLKLKPMKVSANIRSKTYAETMTNSDFM
eukprot:gene19022-21638_t